MKKGQPRLLAPGYRPRATTWPEGISLKKARKSGPSFSLALHNSVAILHNSVAMMLIH